MSPASDRGPAAVGRGLAEELAPHYSRFRVAERLLLTGHSHQAWPDVARKGQLEAWDDAARDVDDKWERAAEKAERVRRGYARLLGDDRGALALGANTHELVIRFLSALPLRERPRLVSTDGEFHTLRRQLDRLAEERPLEVVRIAAHPAATLAERLAAQVDARTAAVMVSSVLTSRGRSRSGSADRRRITSSWVFTPSAIAPRSSPSRCAYPRRTRSAFSAARSHLSSTSRAASSHASIWPSRATSGHA